MTTGTLFTEDFLGRGLGASPAWRIEGVAAVQRRFYDILAAVKDPKALNEAQTEERIVRPMLKALGWEGHFTVQENLENKGRANVPDYAFFPNLESFAKADETSKADARVAHAVAVGDAKAWAIDLDAQGSGAGKGETAAAQTLRYLLRAEIQSSRNVRFAILTNGRRWRLYYIGAKSLLDDYFEIDLADILALPGTQIMLGAPQLQGESDPARRSRLFATFVLAFRREAFSPDPLLDGQTFHAFALAEGAKWEVQVRTSLSEVVFREVFPGLIRGIAAADVSAPKPYTAEYLESLREAALTILYRLLFALYAEDRALLPTHTANYRDYSLSQLRDEIAVRTDEAKTFSDKSKSQWDICATIFRMIDEGDQPIGIPPYNGGLFAKARAPLLDRIAISDRDFAPLLDKLSRTFKGDRLVRINFRDLSVRELGAIYEGLLEFEPVEDLDAPAGIRVRPNAFSRKNTGSYYTPDELVSLIIERTIGPLVEEKIRLFADMAVALGNDRRAVPLRLAELEAIDPAERILDLKICDPAMGSGHFLVSLIDYLARRVFTAMAEAALAVTWSQAYVSPLQARLAEIRRRISAEAEAQKWTIRPEQLNDQNLVKRMVLKRCVFGVDKNPMAVELAKVALWLHTFTAGAPLSFLDHHLRCGDSLFGENIRRAIDELAARSIFKLDDPLKKAEASILSMEKIERLSDAAISEVQESDLAFRDIELRTSPLKKFLDVWQAAKWVLEADKKDAAKTREFNAFAAIVDGSFGNPFEVIAGLAPPKLPLAANAGKEEGALVRERIETAKNLLARLRAFAAHEHFFHWEVAFPGVWRNWKSAAPEGGFDAVIGNPPWDRMKMQEVEWFAARAPAIAKQPRAADRKKMIAALRTAGDPLAAEYDIAAARADKGMERARRGGEYPLLSKGDINLYSLFVERAQALIKPNGIAGLLTPSGIASDFTASVFFKSVASTGRLACLFDFENRRGGERGAFFPDVDSRFKFCVAVIGGKLRFSATTECAFFLRDKPELESPDKLFRLTSADFTLVNPNTGTAPIFRSKRDADLTTAIYRRLPVLIDRSSGAEVKAWPVKYMTMFHMTNDSHLFWTRARLEAHGAYPVKLGRWEKGEEEWAPLYEGKMVQAFDHRAANVIVNDENLHRPSQPEASTLAEHADPDFTPEPQYWVEKANTLKPGLPSTVLGFKEITAPTNERGMIGALVPLCSFGNTLPVFYPASGASKTEVALWCGCFNAIAFDFVARSKIQGQHLNLFILEQLPVIPPTAYSRAFGAKTAEAIVKDHVLRLTYTAWDMEPFARDMGYAGDPFKWDEDERRHLRARLDALYFHLYGITQEADIRYILSTFPIVARKDRAAHDGVFLTEELILWYFRALGAGDADGEAPQDTLIRNARRAPTRHKAALLTP